MSDTNQMLLQTGMCAVAFILGMGVTNTLRLFYKPHQFIVKTGVSAIWIGIGGVGLFLLSNDAMMTNLITAFALLGFGVRTFMEVVLGYHQEHHYESPKMAKFDREHSIDRRVHQLASAQRTDVIV